MCVHAVLEVVYSGSGGVALSASPRDGALWRLVASMPGFSLWRRHSTIATFHRTRSACTYLRVLGSVLLGCVWAYVHACVRTRVCMCVCVFPVSLSNDRTYSVQFVHYGKFQV